MLLATAIMLATTIFAWITLSDKAKVKDFIVPVGVESATLTFQMKKNDDIDYEYVRTFEQISKVIGNSLPNDKYYFRLSVKNNNQIPEQITVKLHNIKNKNTNEGYNLCFTVVVLKMPQDRFFLLEAFFILYMLFLIIVFQIYLFL